MVFVGSLQLQNIKENCAFSGANRPPELKEW